MIWSVWSQMTDMLPASPSGIIIWKCSATNMIDTYQRSTSSPAAPKHALLLGGAIIMQYLSKALYIALSKTLAGQLSHISIRLVLSLHDSLSICTTGNSMQKSIALLKCWTEWFDQLLLLNLSDTMSHLISGDII